MARSPIPDLIERFHQMSPEEQRCFLDLVDPQPQTVEKPSAKKRKTRTGGSKSPRASNMAETLKERREEQQRTAELKCAYVSDGKSCLGAEGDGVHDKSMGYGSYHEFVSPEAQAARAGD